MAWSRSSDLAAWPVQAPVSTLQLRAVPSRRWGSEYGWGSKWPSRRSREALGDMPANEVRCWTMLDLRLGQAVEAYNRPVATLEMRVMVPICRLLVLGGVSPRAESSPPFSRSRRCPAALRLPSCHVRDSSY